MKNAVEIIQNLFPIVIMAVLTSTLTTVSTQGVKNFFNVELKGNVARLATVVITIVWSYILTVHYGGGTITDFILVVIMTFLGATGIYEVLMQKQKEE
ncbi:hypothetical protein [Breznakia pachnodae]|uniref:Holin n=1 Tax=Breznakia pachnodae TaxID=265178 RepID=A0ABU0DYI4_9FIRM|nr:hypothetical protein [Breznakia pachnodae]MDQ0359695.1 hypothetical protein [Breznakia pachnodae]